MQLSIHGSYEEMSAKAAEAVIRLGEELTAPLVCIPSGNTPVLFCKHIVDHYRENETKPDWYFVGLDEWIGVASNVKGSCRHFMDEHLFKPLGIPENRICFFDGTSSDIPGEQVKTEQWISKHGGIKIAVLGLGTNGHLGFNEPGSDPTLRTQVMNLDETTLVGGAKYFDSKQESLQKGITLGLQTIMEASTVFLLVNGKHKAAIVHKVIEGPVDISVPASILLAPDVCPNLRHNFAIFFFH